MLNSEQVSEFFSSRRLLIRYLYFGSLCFILALSALIIQRLEVSMSHILIQDDQSYVVDFLIHDAGGANFNLEYLRLMVDIFGVQGSRIFIIITAAIAAALLSCGLYFIIKNVIVSAAPVIACAIPLSMTQFIFLNDSHTTTTFLPIAFYVLSLLFVWKSNGIAVIAIAAFFAIFSAFFAYKLTTIAPLLSLSALVILLPIILDGGKMRLKSAIILVIALSIPIVFYIDNFAYQ